MSEPTEEEKNQSPEERLAWLRARGVLVEMPNERQGPGASGDGRTFAFVKIPVDESLPCEERSAPACDGDGLPALLGPEFAGCSLSDADLAAHAAAAGQTLDVKLLRSMVERGSCEQFRLAVPTAGNGRQAVCVYIDETSAWKGLPQNARASALAAHCGFPASCTFSGDVFVGRQKWSDAGEVQNIDFKVGELGPSTLWIRRSVTENLEFQKTTQREEHEKAQMQSGEKPASGEGEGYTWKDEAEDLEVIVQMPAGTAKKDVKVVFKRTEVVISKPITLNLKLHKPVEVDGCNWTVGKDSQLVLTLEKSAAAPWPQLLVA